MEELANKTSVNAPLNPVNCVVKENFRRGKISDSKKKNGVKCMIACIGSKFRMRKMCSKKLVIKRR